MPDSRRARHRRVTLATLGALLATAVSLAAAAPASAQFAMRGYITHGNASAGWIDEPDAPPGSTDQQSIGLFVNGTSPEDLDDAARAIFEGFGGAPDPNPPSFDFKVATTGASGGSVRLLLRFSDGGAGELRPVTLPSGQWSHESGSAAADWDTRGGSCGSVLNQPYSQVLACHPGATLTGMELVNDSGWLHPGGFQILVDNVTYGADTISRPAPPVLGESFTVTQLSGPVIVRRGTSKRNLARIEGTANLPVGSVIDTRRGHAQVVSSRGRRRQASNFTGGLFRVKQKRRARGLTELVLRGSLGCPSRGATRASASGPGRANAAATRRRLWARGRGSFRTRGRYSAGSVRGTKWLTVDRCDGTLTIVRKGVVAVRDFRLKETVFVRAGQRYFARAILR